MPFDGVDVSEVKLTLIAARALLENGWGQGNFVRYAKNAPAQYCVIGAVRQVLYGLEPQSAKTLAHPMQDKVQLEEQARHCLEKQLRGSAAAFDIEVWNDRVGRRKADVLAVVDRAIAAAE